MERQSSITAASVYHTDNLCDHVWYMGGDCSTCETILFVPVYTRL